MYTHIYVCICINVLRHALVYIVYMYAHKYTYFRNIHLCIHVCMFAYMYIYVYMPHKHINLGMCIGRHA